MVPVRARLFLGSALMLFLELALIRWAGANVVHLSYLANFVLLGSFLGIGVGFLRARRPRDRTGWSPLLLAAFVALVSLFPVTVDQRSADVLYFTAVQPAGPPPWIALPVIFVAVAAVMAGPGEIVGRCFRELPGLDAYRLDLIGSLAGVGGFTLLSFLGAPPLAWGVVVAVCYVVLLARRLPLLSWSALVVMLAFLGMESVAPGVSWSPYYEVRTTDRMDPAGRTVSISANGIPHQDIKPVERLLTEDPRYRLPYERLPESPLDEVLIVGAGNGNDVAVALHRGARRVDAVEIDPRLLEIGHQRHPDAPYADARVVTHVDDGRAFLQRSDDKYDLIIFALPDSLTLVTGAASIRLESYLFTEEALQAVRDHLRPGGGFAMYNNYRERWLIDRFQQTMAETFGHPPCVDTFGRAGQLAVLSISSDPAGQRCAVANPSVTAQSPPPAPSSDDHPFPYLRTRGIPALYLFVIVGILVVSLVGVRLVAGPFRTMRPYADLFLMGMAFLLLETKYVTGFALLFGTTWVVNAIVFAGVLFAVLIAVEVTRRWRTPRIRVLFAALIAALLVAWLVPAAALLELPLVPRLFVAVVLAFAPIFLANVIFAKRLAAAGDAATAIGANLLGAMVGGCLEYAALVVGYNALLLLAGLLYVAALVATARVDRAALAGVR
ncbi:MAG: spermidine synthase [Jiangellaceae bacterium]|nr:spermidine synthase [Jiangellaceae bacterium]